MSEETQFPGFPSEEQTWDFPTILNGYVHQLSGAQFKVLWYILRHTYGWQKSEDAISLTQFTDGIKKKDGEWLDRGTGLSRKEVWSSLQELKKMGFVEIITRLGKTAIIRPRLVKKILHPSVESTSVGVVENTPTIPNITIPNKTNNNASASPADIVDKLLEGELKNDRIRYDYQYLGLEIFEKTKAPGDKRAECIRIARVYPRGKVMTALSFCADYPNQKLKWKMFLWKLHYLLKNEKYRGNPVVE